MTGQENGNHDSENGKPVKRPSKVRDIFTDRVVGIISGAFIPLVLLFIPLINKYLDNTKEIQTLQIQNNADDIEATNQRVAALTQALVGSQIQLQSLMVDLKKAMLNLDECQKGCDSYCKSVTPTPKKA